MVQNNSETSTVCIVRDTLPESTQGKMSLMVRPSYSVEQLFNDVATQFQYKPNEFELVLQATKDASHIVLNEQRDKTCGDVGVNFDQGARNTLIIGPLRSQSRRKAVFDEDDLVLGASASPTAPIGPPVASSPLPALLPADSISNCLPMKDTSAGFVGLVNQAMTCYLNSLLQALYMTPEFRNALYNWQFDGSEETKSIPFQLQKLFLNLQTSTRSAIETTDLTKSFGWDSTEAWQQHDIQELCRVMFDALEQKFKKTKQADLINRLYEGKMIDYVRCLRCRVEKSREDTFLDIPLPVRPFGSSVAYNSVEEALRAFVQPETLDGNNQYHCDKCDTKCDAHKGLKFSRFPYLLTLHLKRFDFDYQTLHRIKLNDKVSFPETLNLNGFIGGINEGNTESPEENSTGSSKAPEDRLPCDDSSTTDSGSALDDECADKENHTNSIETDFQDYDEGIDMALSSGDRSIRSADRPGPYKYELFSIMIHSGSASGGHYYAYIKDFKTNQWFCFNDQSVMPITQEDIHKTYGGGPLKGYYSGAYTSSTNAYMLMYRQIDRQRNVHAIEAEDFPEHIKELLIKLKDREETDRKMKEIEMGMCKIKLYCHHPTKRELVESKLYIFNDVSLEEATIEAYKKLSLEEVIPIDQCRLVTFDRTSDTIDRSFDDQEDYPMGEILSSTRHNYNEMLLEIRDPDKDFKRYKPGGVNTKVFFVDINTEEIEGPTMVRGNVSQSILEFKETIVEELNLKVKPESLYLVIEKYSNGPKLLEDNFKLKNECIHGQNKFFVSTALDSDADKPFSISKLNKIIDRFEHVIMLHISLPETDKETLETLSIPSYDANQNSQNDSPIRNHVHTPTSQPMLNLRTNSPQHPTVATNPAGAGDTVDAVMLTGSPVPPLEGENSEDSSLSESDRTLVGDAPQETSYNMLAHDLNDDEIDDEDITKIHYKTHYFKSTPYHDNNVKMLKVFVDKRMVVGSLKNCLQPSVGVPMEYFKLYRVYSSNQECECTRLSESLGSFRDEERLSIRLGRALRKGEHRGKVFFLRENNTEHTVFICEWVLACGTTVGQFKGDLLREKQIDIPFERCRLRKKNWKNPAKIYLDNMKFGDDIVLFSNWELYLQDLAPPSEVNIEKVAIVNGLDNHVEKDTNINQSNDSSVNNNETIINEIDSKNQIVYEKVTSTDQLVLFVKRWYPEKLELGKFDEVVLTGVTIDELKERIHEISNIPIAQIEFAKAPNSFPCDMSVLSVHTELEWSPQTTSLDVWPLNVFEDGSVFIYRDRNEKLRELTAEERREIVSKEGPRFGRYGATSTTHSPRREKALKIYLDNSPKKKDLID